MMEKTESMLQARQKLSDYVRINSLRNTQEREALLDAIYMADVAYTADELCRRMSGKQFLRISRATVYNNLVLFEKAGLVRKSYLNDQVVFERTDRTRGVIRMICGGCGKVTEMNDDRVRHQIGEMKTRRFTMSGWTLNIHGLCSKCSASLKRKQNRLKNKDKDKK